MKSERPFVTCNFALTWDGRVSTRNKTPTDFTSPRDKRRLLEIRARGDALLVGAATVRADNMAMGMPAADLRAERIERGQAPYPLRVLLSGSGRIDPSWKVFQKRIAPVVIFTTRRMKRSVRDALGGKATLHVSESSEVDLTAMMRTLRRQYRVKRLVCEGGPSVFRALLDLDLVDEVHITLCPRIFGGEKAPALTGAAGEFLRRSKRLRLREMKVVEGECFLRYRLARDS